MRRLAVSALCLTVLLGTAASTDVVAASPAPAAPSASAVRTVTLPTGDRVAVTRTATGQPSVTLAPGNAGHERTRRQAVHLDSQGTYDPLGRRANADLGTVMNADNVDNFLGGQSYYRGQFAFSVPAGTYSITSYISTGHSDGSVDITLATDPEVSVVYDTVVILDARKGVRLSASVSRPTTQVSGQPRLTDLMYSDTRLESPCA